MHCAIEGNGYILDNRFLKNHWLMAAHHLGNNRINALFHPSASVFSQSKLLKKYVFGTFYICF